MKNKVNKYTEEHVSWVKANCKGKTTLELTTLFNDHFNTDMMTHGKMKSFMTNRGITNGVDARFKKGQKSWNKGLSYNPGGRSVETRFKKGNTPINYRPIGSERVNVDGYVEIKVADPNKWKLKHRVIYEESYGKIPKGYALLFADQNKQNFAKENLVLISRHELLLMNQHGYATSDPEITKAGHAVVKLIKKIQEAEDGD